MSMGAAQSLSHGLLTTKTTEELMFPIRLLQRRVSAINPSLEALQRPSRHAHFSAEDMPLSMGKGCVWPRANVASLEPVCWLVLVRDTPPRRTLQNVPAPISDFIYLKCAGKKMWCIDPHRTSPPSRCAHGGSFCTCVCARVHTDIAFDSGQIYDSQVTAVNISIREAVSNVARG